MSLLILSFVQIGILEESAKFATFLWVSKERTSEKYDFPIATMFYSMMSAVGFAITENIVYLIRAQRQIIEIQNIGIDLSKELINIAEMRSVTSVIAHMICGVIMGYFLAKAHEINYEKTNSKFKKYKTIVKGIVFAALFHGAYDYNLLLENNLYQIPFAIFILVFGLIIGRFIINELIMKSINKKQKQTINIKSNEIKE